LTHPDYAALVDPLSRKRQRGLKRVNWLFFFANPAKIAYLVGLVEREAGYRKTGKERLKLFLLLPPLWSGKLEAESRKLY
jgi:hypothetical protein